MTLIDVIQTASMIMALFAIGSWSIRLRHWPLALAVVVAMLSNIAFYLARSFNWFTPSELNLFSSVRVLLMVVVIAVFPFSIERTK
jgi:cytochrome b subunit of formate dehydrogenase